jgi:hypothetical protein
MIDSKLSLWLKFSMPKQKLDIINGLFPARLTAEETASLLGFQIHDIPVLVAQKQLKPLGKPAQNASKHFSLCQIARIAQDENWLNKATQCLYDYWRDKNTRKSAESGQSNRVAEGPPPEEVSFAE